MIGLDSLNKLNRISEVVRNLSAAAQKEERQNLHSYKTYYISQYELIKPILYYNMDYQLEFQALQKPENLSYTDIKPAMTSLSTFIDSVIKQETLGDRQHEESFVKEYFIDENQPFTAYKQITDIVNVAVKSLKIVDNYVESSTLDFFLAVNTQTNIKVLTMKCLPKLDVFKTAVTKFISQWGGNNFEIKISQYFHDRFIIVDDMQVWHLGPSLNRLGKKPMMISLIQDEEIRKKVVEIFDKQWGDSEAT